MLNNVTLLGKVSDPVKSSTTQNGHPMVNFKLETTTKGFGKDAKDMKEWHNCTAFGDTAKSLANVKVDEYVYATGRIQTRKYQDNKDGATKYFTSVACSNAQLFELPATQQETYDSSSTMHVSPAEIPF